MQGDFARETKVNWMLAVLLAFLPIALRQTNSTDLPLSSYAKQVMETTSWVPMHNISTSYAWLSQEKLLFSQQSDSSLAKHAKEYGWNVAEPVVWDFGSGLQQPAKTFNKSVREWGARPMEVSPDGKWIIGYDIVFGSGPTRWFAHSTEESKVITGPLYSGNKPSNSKWRFIFDPYFISYEARWTPDSKRWARLEGVCAAPLIAIYDLAAPETSYVVQLPVMRSHSGKSDPVDSTLLGFTSNEEVLIASARFGECKDVLIYLFNLSKNRQLDKDGSAVPLAVYTVHLPKPARLQQVILSPKGDHLAWRFDCVRVLTYDGVRQRSTTSEIWLSKINGSQMHAVGFQEVGTKARDQDDESLLLQDMHWLPDGNLLSFRYRDALWTVPANGLGVRATQDVHTNPRRRRVPIPSVRTVGRRPPSEGRCVPRH
jgi:hypothetical protein